MTLANQSPHSIGKVWAMPLTAAAVVCLSFFLFISFFNRAESLVFVEFADGAVFRNDLSTAILESGSELPAGTVQIESASGSAQLRFDDGTLVTLEGESELAISDSRQGKWLQLRSGRLSADVAAQPADAPLRITTPTAEAEVLEQHMPDSNGWREALVSMSDFQPVAALRHRGFHLDGNTVTKIIISVHGDESIQLATLAVTDE